MDPAGWTFIGSAGSELGVAMFGESWTGEEPTVDGVQPTLRRVPSWRIPERINSSEDHDVALKAMQSLAPNLNLRPPLPAGTSQNALFGLGTYMTEEGWTRFYPGLRDEAALQIDLVERANREAQEAADKHNAEARPKIDRFLQVCRELVQAAESGLVKTAHRDRMGGRMYDMDRNHWNTERWLSRFLYGAYHVDAPFGTHALTDTSHYIFFQRSGLDDLAALHAGPPRQATLGHPSLYLRVMLQVADRLALSPTNQPKKSVLEAEIRSAWPKGVLLTGRLLSAMATLLREPESQKGRAGVNKTSDGPRL